jgi:hypothetical protein
LADAITDGKPARRPECGHNDAAQRFAAIVDDDA